MKSAKPLAALTVVVLGVAGVSALLSDAPPPAPTIDDILQPGSYSDAPPPKPPADFTVSAGSKSPVATVDRSTWRQAVASWDCLQDEGIDADKLREVCIWGRLKAGHIICLTDREQAHKCEVDPPAALLKRYGICRYRIDGEWRLHKGWAAIDWTPPAEWENVACTVILPSGFWHQSMSGVEDALVLALRELCGWGGAITPTSWGNCPDCLQWPEGCGPCRAIADKYGRGWPGHEAECEVE